LGIPWILLRKHGSEVVFAQQKPRMQKGRIGTA
jgi:hypothetical protein